MATNPRWRQPRHVWRSYFTRWIAEPDDEAQMLASVMFDLRPISGDRSLFADLQDDVLGRARGNSIFVQHMVANSLKHTPPLSLFRGFALIRSGEHKNTLDLKHSGVVPMVDLARVYALRGAIGPVNTRERLALAPDAGVISTSGARDLLDAYDLIATTRLRHQASRIRDGAAPDNFLAPGELSELERSHLRDAFMVVKTMQSALGQGR
jgi:CBS domain-containing protein